MNTKGFTLLEVIAAIFILTIGVGSSFILISQTLSAVSLVRERLIASYLVQEGIEIVRNIRDTNWLEQRTASTTPWDDGLDVGNWQADYLSQQLNQTYASSSLNIDTSGFYSYSPGSPTFFKRKISIGKPSTSTIRVEVNVDWTEKGRSHNLESLEYLTNWYEK